MKVPRLLVVVVALAVASTTTALAGPVNVAKRAGIAQKTRSYSVNPVDFNRDGRDDFFFVRHNPDNLPLSTLYRGTRRGRFTVHGSAMFGRSDKHGCAWGDANRDRRPDMFCAIGLTQKSKHELWIQRSNGSFENQAKARGLHSAKTFGRYRYATFIHANNDRRPDIYVARYTGSCNCDRNDDGQIDYDGDSHPNELWINGRKGFRRAPEFGLNKPVGAQKDTNSCAQAVDFDRDRDQDLLVCSGEGLRLYRNNNGRGFSDVTKRFGIAGPAADARLVHINRDGRRDLVRLKRKELTVRYGRRSEGFRRARRIDTLSAGAGLAFGKFNRGRTTDIYVLTAGSKRGRRNERDKILLRRRNGGFRELLLPLTPGRGDDVAALDYNGDKRADFLVANGDRKRSGPLQLFTWAR